MTDKEKIREEVERLQNELIQEKEKGYGSDVDDACILELQNVLTYIDSLQEEPVSIWHDSSEEPNDKSSCLIHYIVGGEVSYRDIFPVLYNKEAREFVSEPYPHPTGYKVEQSSLEGGVVAEVYKDMRDRFPLSDIYKWAYIDDILNLSNVERTVKYLKEMPASEDLGEATNNYCLNVRKGYPRVKDETDIFICDAFEAGAQWQKAQEYTCYEEAFEDGAKWKVENLWKPADGDDLPEYEREVVVFTQNYPDDVGMMMVAIGHRPTPEGYDGKSFTTGEVEHYIPKTYGKGGWNIPNITYWLDVKLPKE